MKQLYVIVYSIEPNQLVTKWFWQKITNNRNAISLRDIFSHEIQSFEHADI